jgi:hypothetical protein
LTQHVRFLHGSHKIASAAQAQPAPEH